MFFNANNQKNRIWWWNDPPQFLGWKESNSYLQLLVKLSKLIDAAISKYIHI